MVALHNKRLTARDIWPDNIWDWADEKRVRRMIEAKLIDEGVGREDFAFTFRMSKEMDEYRKRVSPGTLGDQQRVMRRIYPPKPAVTGFTREELEAIMERFEYANDDQGRAIFHKAAEILGRPASRTPSIGGS